VRDVLVIDWKDVAVDVCDVKSSLTFAPWRVTVLVIGLKFGPEAVTVIVPDVPMGIAYPPADDETA
jgi:hypothetical protein